MKLKKLILFLISLFFVVNASLSRNKVDAPKPIYPIPSANQLTRQEMELCAFVHFSINTFTDLEWGMGNEKESMFNPTKANPNQWVKVLKGTGFKGIILTCKHHDGFCLWPSKYTEHSIKNSPYKNGKGDIVKELSNACKKQNVKFGIYLSPWDRNRADYGTPTYVEYYRKQLKELFDSYGPVFEMWFDGANGGTGYYGGSNENRKIDGKTYYDWPKTLEMIRVIEPEIIFFSDAGPGVRWVGNEDGYVGTTNWCQLNSDTLYAGKQNINQLLNEGSEHGTSWVPAEVDVSIRPGWFYHQKEDEKVKSPVEIFNIYLTSVGRGAMLLLNIPPDRRGLIHENDVKSLKGFREILDREFKTNLADNKIVTATSTRGNDKEFAPANITDKKKETYWTTDDNIISSSLEINLDKVKTVKYIVLQEYIKLGQRIRKFNVEVKQGNVWIKVAEETTVGYKRILKINPIQTDQIRITILESRACPIISNVEVY